MKNLTNTLTAIIIVLFVLVAILIYIFITDDEYKKMSNEIGKDIKAQIISQEKEEKLSLCLDRVTDRDNINYINKFNIANECFEELIKVETEKGKI